MTITIFGATGMVGRRLVTHAIAAGHKVRAFGRNVDNLIDRDFRDDQFSVVKGYVFDTHDVEKALRGSDAVLSALGGSADGKDKSRSLGMKNIVMQMQKTGLQRIVAVSGTGILPMPNGSYFLNDPSYEKQYLSVGEEHLAAYTFLRDSHMAYTAVCPPQILDLDADGHFTVAEEQLPAKWQISAGNLALFMVQELEARQYVQKRVTLYNH